MKFMKFQEISENVLKWFDMHFVEFRGQRCRLAGQALIKFVTWNVMGQDELLNHCPDSLLQASTVILVDFNVFNIFYAFFSLFSFLISVFCHISPHCFISQDLFLLNSKRSCKEPENESNAFPKIY